MTDSYWWSRSLKSAARRVLALGAVALTMSGCAEGDSDDVRTATQEVLASDDFDGTLTGTWQFVDPVGDSNFNVNSTHLLLSVPGGTEHDAWQQNMAARLMQSVGDVDFDVEAKFDTVPSQKYQLHGIVAELDQNDFVRFDYYSDGSSVHFFAASFVNGAATVRKNSVVSLSPGHRLRVTRTGDTWTASSSSDGVSWTQLVSFDFSLAVANVGVMAGNDGVNPAYTASVDYFRDATQPPPPACTDGPYVLSLNTAGNGSVTASPNQAEYACDDVVTLTATPDSGNVFAGFTGDLVDSQNTVQFVPDADMNITANFDVAPVVEPSLVSDSFDSALDAAWTFVDPVGDSSYGVNGSQLSLSVPAGTEHDSYKLLESPRLMQAVGDVDFEVEAKFDTVPSQKYQLHGIVAEKDDNDYVRFDYYSDGSSVHFFAASFVNGAPNVRRNQVVSLSPGHRLKVNRTGDTWTASASPDGVSWTQMVSFDFSLAVADLGVMAGNDGANPAYTALVDYFVDTSNPVEPPPPCTGGPYVLDLSVSGAGSVTASPVQATYACDDLVTVTATPDSGNVFSGFTGDLVDSQSSVQFVPDADMAITANFDVAPVIEPSLLSDAFDNALTADWDFVDPVGDSNFSVTSSHLSLEVPAGTEHDAYKVLHSPRLMQAVGDVDFEVEAKFDSVPTQKYQLHGIVAEKDEDDFVRFDFYSNGSEVRFFAASFVASSPNVRANTVVSLSPGHRLRVNRTGDTWTASTSPDGVSWTQMVSFNFSLAVADVGVMAGNDGDNPGYTALVDYFLDTSSPIEPPPPCTGGPYFVNLTVTAGGSVTTNPDRTDFDCDEVFTLTATPEPGYIFTGFTGDFTSTESSVDVIATQDLDITASFVLEPIVASEIASDDFSGALNGQFMFLDPLADGSYALTQAPTGDSHLSINVPAGTEHDAWQVLEAPRMVQPIDDVDFEVEAKFDSLPTEKYQLHGIVAEKDSTNFVRFDYFSDGAQTRFFAATFINGQPTIRANIPVALERGHRLRVSRAGATWSAYGSPDGVNWNLLVTFNFGMVVGDVGVMAGNSGASPAYTALVDYFFDTSSPVSPEDCEIGTPFTLTIEPATGGVVTVSPQKAQYLCGEKITLTATPDPGATFTEWTQGPIGYGDVVTLDVSSNLTVAGTFDYPTLEIDLWYGNDLHFGQIGSPQEYVNVLGHADASAGLAGASYTLNGGPSRPLSVDRETYRLVADGDFNADIATSDLNVGDNEVVITVEDVLGNTATEVVNVNWTAGTVWPDTYSIDWSTVSEIQDVAQVVDGNWLLTPGGVRIVEPGYDRLLAFGDASWTDVEILVPVTINALKDPEFWPPVLGVVTRWNGHYDWDGGVQPYRGWYPNGGIVTYSWPLGGSFEGIKIWQPKGLATTFSDGIPELLVGETYYMRFRIISLPTGRAHYDIKFWPVGEVEPAGWVLSTDSTDDALASGSLMLVAHNVDATFGNVQVTPVTP